MRVHLGAYAASPCHAGWDEAAETAYYAGLRQLGLAGLEHPYWDRLHKHDDAWFLDALDPAWTLLITTLPGTMDRLKDDPHYGLASADKDGRRRALDVLEGCRRTIKHLHHYLGRRVVKAVEVHSAPRLGSGAKADLEAFSDSLTLLRTGDWDGATLLVEHCDAYKEGQTPDKGFLSIEDEAIAIRRASGTTPISLLINWGRSAIETRSVDGPISHLQRAVDSGLLGGLVFSGADAATWKDSHAPFGSLLTPAAAANALSEAGPDLPFLGLKMQPLPRPSEPAACLSFVKTQLETLRSCTTTT